MVEKPLHPASFPRQSGGLAERPRSRKPRILIVEDEAGIAAELGRTVAELGCEVIGPVASVTEARDLARGTSIDGAIVDVLLVNGETAYPLVDELLADGIPIAFATEDGSPLLPRYSDLMAAPKPFPAEAVGRLIAALGQDPI